MFTLLYIATGIIYYQNNLNNQQGAELVTMTTMIERDKAVNMLSHTEFWYVLSLLFFLINIPLFKAKYFFNRPFLEVGYIYKRWAKWYINIYDTCLILFDELLDL